MNPPNRARNENLSFLDVQHENDIDLIFSRVSQHLSLQEDKDRDKAKQSIIQDTNTDLEELKSRIQDSDPTNHALITEKQQELTQNILELIEIKAELEGDKVTDERVYELDSTQTQVRRQIVDLTFQINEMAAISRIFSDNFIVNDYEDRNRSLQEMLKEPRNKNNIKTLFNNPIFITATGINPSKTNEFITLLESENINVQALNDKLIETMKSGSFMLSLIPDDYLKENSLDLITKICSINWSTIINRVSINPNNQIERLKAQLRAEFSTFLTPNINFETFIDEINSNITEENNRVTSNQIKRLSQLSIGTVKNYCERQTNKPACNAILNKINNSEELLKTRLITDIRLFEKGELAELMIQRVQNNTYEIKNLNFLALINLDSESRESTYFSRSTFINTFSHKIGTLYRRHSTQGLKLSDYSPRLIVGTSNYNGPQFQNTITDDIIQKHTQYIDARTNINLETRANVIQTKNNLRELKAYKKELRLQIASATGENKTALKTILTHIDNKLGVTLKNLGKFMKASKSSKLDKVAKTKAHTAGVVGGYAAIAGVMPAYECYRGNISKTQAVTDTAYNLQYAIPGWGTWLCFKDARRMSSREGWSWNSVTSWAAFGLSAVSDIGFGFLKAGIISARLALGIAKSATIGSLAIGGATLGYGALAENNVISDTMSLIGDILGMGDQFDNIIRETSYEAGRVTIVEDLREECKKELNLRRAIFNTNP